jgi:cyanophycinase
MQHTLGVTKTMRIVACLRALALVVVGVLACAVGPAGAAGWEGREAGVVAQRGAVVVVGGALRPDNAAVWQRIVALSGGAGARIAVIPAASGDPRAAGERLAQTLKRYGAAAFVLPLSPKLPGDVHVAANDPALAAAVRSADGVYFTGGDQGRITASLRNVDGKNSLVLDAVWDLLRRGGMVAGSSAGAAIMSTTMFYDAPSILAALRNGVRDGREIAPGLGFVGPDVFVDQHLLVRGRFARMLPAMRAKGYQIGIGIDENSAAVFDANRAVEVIGYSGAILIELAQSGADTNAGAFNIEGARISYLDSGDRFDPVDGVITPSPDKIAGTLDATRPSFLGPIRSADILGNHAVVNLMGRLIDSDQREAIGLAFGAAEGSPDGKGFEFRFSREAQSSGYASATSERYSVYRLRLDVRPIDVRWPQY